MLSSLQSLRSPPPRQPATQIPSTKSALNFGMVFYLGGRQKIPTTFMLLFWLVVCLFGEIQLSRQVNLKKILDSQTVQSCLHLLIKDRKRQWQEHGISGSRKHVSCRALLQYVLQHTQNWSCSSNVQGSSLLISGYHQPSKVPEVIR